ncbi:DNA (cytosine-5-)-methyltransferase [Candidatus Saccharibacteria bacterium]|nr:DNA (cytosine-5-)-methyltransferase [Candidatus Saccharibacteria bacterium]
MPQYKMIDLFAGIGGIRLGFDRAFGKKAKTVFASEIDYYAINTYENNFRNDFYVSGDITQIDARDVPPFDICLAGFPCQAFSIAGRRAGFNDDYYGSYRGTLFREVVRICEYHRPKVIFCENVKGLVNHDRGKTFKTICAAFADIGYTVHYKVLNSKDFGLAQNRERVYMVCFRSDINDLKFIFPPPEEGKWTLADILEDAPIPSKYYISSTYLETLRRHRKRHEDAGNGFGFIIRDLNDIAGALVCGGMGREKNLIVDPREHSTEPMTRIKGEINKENIRKMTPREWARLQGFPDSFLLYAADTQLYKQLGNTVSVNVVEAVARQIKKVLK